MERTFPIGDKSVYIRELILSGELGTQIWDATFVMFRYMETELDFYKGKRILELGAGTGILGVGAALIGAREVVITDLPQLVPLIEENIKMNNATNAIAKALTWGDDPSSFNPPFDIILIADVVRIRPEPLMPYQSKTMCKYQITELYSDQFHKLVQTIRDMSDQKTRIILAFEKRMRNKEETFFKLLLDNDFTHDVIKDAYKWDPTYESETRMTIYEIRRK